MSLTSIIDFPRISFPKTTIHFPPESVDALRPHINIRLEHIRNEESVLKWLLEHHGKVVEEWAVDTDNNTNKLVKRVAILVEMPKYDHFTFHTIEESTPDTGVFDKHLQAYSSREFDCKYSKKFKGLIASGRYGCYTVLKD